MSFPDFLKQSDIQQIIADNLDISPADFALKFSGQSDFPVKEIATQIDCYQRAMKKFPDIHQLGLAYSRKAIEQSTGEAMIRFKTLRYSGNHAIDLTGGLGMDSLAFAQSFQRVDYVERDSEPLHLAKHNHEILGIRNITHHKTSAEKFLTNFDGVADLIYLDPSRRDEHQRVFLLSDSQPDVIAMWDELRHKAKSVVIKLSPIYDLKRLANELPGISEILVISVHGEVKEILAEWNGENSAELKISAILLDQMGAVKFRCAEKNNNDITVAENAGNFLLEPDAAIIKSGLSNQVARKYDLEFLNNQTDYLTGNTAPQLFPGNCYQILDVLEFKPKKIKRYLSDKKLERVHIHKRDFPLSPDQLFKKLNLSMGEQAHLFFTKNKEDELICLVCIMEHR